jgi:MFS family permease
MRRLLPFVAAVVCVDSLLYAALTPLLPHFTHELGLSKARAGALVAAYGAGALVGALPGGLAAARFGPRRAVLVGLSLMGAAGLAFAFAGEFWTLLGARFLQGCGSAFTWSGALAWLLAVAPRERRGELLGNALGAAVFGILFGPVVGAAAALIGRGPVFSAVAALAVVLGAWALRIAPAPAQRTSTESVGRAFRNRRFVAGLALMTLPALLFGALSVLAPLHLADAGWGAAAIAAVFLFGAALEMVEAPLVGRLIDRRGRLLPVRIALAVGVLLSLGLAAGARPLVYVPMIIVATLAYSLLFTPAFALIADGAEEAELPQGMAFGFMNVAWASGAMIGPAAAGAIAAATSDTVPFVLAAVLCAVALVGSRPAMARRAERMAGA